jgi:hypothetical protein
VSKWISDPELEAGEETIAAVRRSTGTAFMFVPGESTIESFLEFTAGAYVAVGGDIYNRGGDGALYPVTLDRPTVLFRPDNTGGASIDLITPEHFKQQYAIIETDGHADGVIDQAINELMAAQARVNELLDEMAELQLAKREAELIAEDHLAEVAFLKGRIDELTGDDAPTFAPATPAETAPKPAKRTTTKKP